jgi:tetratricopeptide (TPR) repeat protein
MGAVLVFAISVGVRAEDCSHTPLAELPMVPNDQGTPVVSVLIDGKPSDVLLDTGGFWSLIDPSFARRYGSRRSEVVGRLGLQGIKLTRAVRVPSIQIDSLRVSDVDFFVEPDGYLRAAATLGGNWLGHMDIEIDPAQKKVAFFPINHCRDEIVAWPHSDLAEVPVTVDRNQKLITIPLALDGQEIRALIDTGSPETFLSTRAAKRLFGLDDTSSSAVSATQQADGVKDGYRRQFHELRMGGIVFRDPWLVVAPVSRDGPDMILGMNDLSSLHLYFAYHENKLYASTVRGDNAARRASGQTVPVAGQSGPIDLTSAHDYRLTAEDALKRRDYDTALAALNNAVRGDPDDAEAYRERGELFTLKGQHDHAAEDFDRAVTLNPKESIGFVERSELYAIGGDGGRALADADRAIELDPKSASAFGARAEADAIKGDWERAMRDADTAVRLGPEEIVGYLARSHIYELTGDYVRALDDADRAVRLQPKSATALNARCWNSAILARLDMARSDCDAAVALRPYSVEILDSRAFVNLQSGQFAPALADYDAALAVNPRFASSLYGRGLTKLRMGDQAAGQADIAEARNIDPLIDQHFGK